MLRSICSSHALRVPRFSSIRAAGFSSASLLRRPSCFARSFSNEAQERDAPQNEQAGSTDARSFGNDGGFRPRRPRPSPPVPNGGPREQGTVKWFDSAKGFGFITRENGTDVFVHFTGLSGEGYRALEEGQKVEFALANGSKGPQAVQVVTRQ